MTDYFRIVPVGGGPSARRRTLHMVCDFSRWEDSKGQRDHCKGIYRVTTKDLTQILCNQNYWHNLGSMLPKIEIKSCVVPLCFYRKLGQGSIKVAANTKPSCPLPFI